MVYLLSIDESYGLVIGAGIVSSFTLTYLGSRVDAARKKYSVPVPYQYLTAEQEAADVTGKKVIFNRVQRGHHNALETYPQFLIFLLLGGLKHPYIAAAAGLGWSLGRVLYATAYETGPANRYKTGGFLYVIAMLTVTVATGSLALTIARII